MIRNNKLYCYSLLVARLMTMWPQCADHVVLLSLQQCIKPQCTGTLTVRRCCWRMAFWIKQEMLMVSIMTRSLRLDGVCWRSAPGTEQHLELMTKPSSWRGIWRDSWLHGENHRCPVTDPAVSLKPRAGKLRRRTCLGLDVGYCSNLHMNRLQSGIDPKAKCLK